MCEISIMQLVSCDEQEQKKRSITIDNCIMEMYFNATVFLPRRLPTHRQNVLCNYVFFQFVLQALIFFSSYFLMHESRNATLGNQFELFKFQEKTHNKPQQKNKKVFVHISRVAVLFVFCAVAKTKKNMLCGNFGSIL